MAPQVDYTKHVFLPFIRRHFGVENVNMNINKRGYFPRGGGEVSLSIVPFANQKLRPCRLMERGKVKWIAGVAHYAGLPTTVGKGMVAGATRCLAAAGFRQGNRMNQSNLDIPDTQHGSTKEQRESNEIPVSISCMREPNNLTKGAGSGIVLWAELEGGGFIGGSAVGTKSVAPEKVGEEAATELIKGLEDGGCVDEVRKISNLFSTTSLKPRSVATRPNHHFYGTCGWAV
jgi:RNA 3'-terminal phosphate cyclase (ATP)